MVAAVTGQPTPTALISGVSDVALLSERRSHAPRYRPARADIMLLTPAIAAAWNHGMPAGNETIRLSILSRTGSVRSAGRRHASAPAIIIAATPIRPNPTSCNGSSGRSMEIGPDPAIIEPSMSHRPNHAASWSRAGRSETKGERAKSCHHAIQAESEANPKGTVHRWLSHKAQGRPPCPGSMCCMVFDANAQANSS